MGALDNELRTVFGAKLESIEARELTGKAKAYTEQQAQEYLALAQQRILGLDQIPEQNHMDFARLYRAYQEYVTQNGIARWPHAAGRTFSQTLSRRSAPCCLS